MNLVGPLSSLALSLCIVLAPSWGQAQDAPGDRVQLPAFGDHVISFSGVEGWKFEALVDRFDRNGQTDGTIDIISLAVKRADQTDRRSYDDVQIYIFPEPVSLGDPDAARGTENTRLSLDWLVDPSVSNWSADTSFEHFGVLDAKMPLVRKTAFSADGETAFARISVRQISDNVLVRSGFNVGPQNQPFDVIADQYNRLFESMKADLVTPAEDQPGRFHHLPETVLTGGDNWLSSDLTFVLPPGWQIETLRRDHAGDAGASGKLLVAAYSDVTFETRVILQMDGVPYKTRIAPEEFLASYDSIVAATLDNAVEIDTPETVTLPRDLKRDDFCRSQYKTRRFSNSDAVGVRTFLGRDILTGMDAKMRVYTSGGITLTCNLALLARAEEFDSAKPEFEVVLKGLRVNSNGTITLK